MFFVWFCFGQLILHCSRFWFPVAIAFFTICVVRSMSHVVSETLPVESCELQPVEAVTEGFVDPITGKVQGRAGPIFLTMPLISSNAISHCSCPLFLSQLPTRWTRMAWSTHCLKECYPSLQWHHHHVLLQSMTMFLKVFSENRALNWLSMCNTF